MAAARCTLCFITAISHSNEASNPGEQDSVFGHTGVNATEENRNQPNTDSTHRAIGRRQLCQFTAVTCLEMFLSARCCSTHP